MAAVFFPGTLVHEMAHFLTALFLLVPVGNMQLMPVIEEHSDRSIGVKLGSVSIARTDPIRRFLVSVAPLIIGTLAILTVIYYVSMYRYMNTWWILFLITYLIFTVTNTMFMSGKDLEGVWGFVAIVLVFLIATTLLGVNINISFANSDKVVSIFQKSVLFLLIPIGLDIITVFPIKIK